MIPLHDYLRVRKQVDQQGGIVVAAVAGAVLLGVGLAFAAISQVPLPHRQHPDWREGLWMITGMVGFVAPLAVTIFLLPRFAIRPSLIPELCCPGCQRVLIDPAGVVVATGKCPKCLKHVIKPDSAAVIAEDKLLTIAQLQRVKRNQ